jgi:hypothetical protein
LKPAAGLVMLALGWGLLPAAAQEATESRELLGHMGGRTALLTLYAAKRPDGAWRITGEYVVLPTLQRRFLEGERSLQLGVTFLKEGNTPILYSRAPSATLQGTWTLGVLKGTRYGPGGQVRERFEFSETFPQMEDYRAAVRCEVSEGTYASTLAYVIEGGRLKSLDWRSSLGSRENSCALSDFTQQPLAGGLRFAAGKRCAVTLRELGDYVRVLAEDCGEFCGPGGHLEPVLVDRRGGCQLLRPRG